MTRFAVQSPGREFVRAFACGSNWPDMHRSPFGMVDSAKPIQQQQCAMSQFHDVRQFGCVNGVEIQFEKVERRW
ncbi:MAG TPA: hypothetical protein VF290_03345 [Pyrinomonadaceae bacterium]